MATAVASSMASSARAMPETRSPYTVSRTAVVIASPESSGMMPPMIAALTLYTGSAICSICASTAVSQPPTKLPSSTPIWICANHG